MSNNRYRVALAVQQHPVIVPQRLGAWVPGRSRAVDLPDPSAARAFAFDEPNYQAGVYRDVLLRRWRNLLRRTMWDFPGPDRW